MPKARVKLASTNIDLLNQVCSAIKDIAIKSGVLVKGPIPIPTKRLKITTRKSPCGDGKATFDRWEMRIHKRVLDFSVNEKVLHSILRTPIPKEVNIEIKIID